MLDYQLSRMFYDLHTDRGLAAEFRADRKSLVARYRLSEAVAAAIFRDDVAFLARRTNPFLLRYYFVVVGMSEADFIAGLQPNREAAHG